MKQIKSTISLCMIVKNEEENLAKCLISVKPIVDEMIIVDTGSTDRTKDLAKAFGARIFDFTWTDDFSKARNFSISKASMDWIFIMDADEMVALCDRTSIKDTIKELISHDVAYSFVTRNYIKSANTVGWIPNDNKYANEEAGSGWIPTDKVRLFSNKSYIRFEYPVHEIVEPSLKKNNVEILKCQIPIHHYGEINRRKYDYKAELYYNIGKKKLNEFGGNPSALRELATQAGNIGKYEEAIELWHKFIAIESDLPDAFIMLGTAYSQLGKYQDAFEMAKRALHLAPCKREALYLYGVCELYLGNADKAIVHLNSLLKKTPEFLPAQFILAAAYSCDGEMQNSIRVLNNLKKSVMAPFLVLCFQEVVKGLSLQKRYEYAISLLETAILTKNINKDILALFSELKSKNLNK